MDEVAVADIRHRHLADELLEGRHESRREPGTRQLISEDPIPQISGSDLVGPGWIAEPVLERFHQLRKDQGKVRAPEGSHSVAKAPSSTT